MGRSVAPPVPYRGLCCTGMEIHRATSLTPVELQPWQRRAHVHSDNGNGRCECGAVALRFDTGAVLANGDSVTLVETIVVSS